MKSHALGMLFCSLEMHWTGIWPQQSRFDQWRQIAQIRLLRQSERLRFHSSNCTFLPSQGVVLLNFDMSKQWYKSCSASPSQQWGEKGGFSKAQFDGRIALPPKVQKAKNAMSRYKYLYRKALKEEVSHPPSEPAAGPVGGFLLKNLDECTHHARGFLGASPGLVLPGLEKGSTSPGSCPPACLEPEGARIKIGTGRAPNFSHVGG